MNHGTSYDDTVPAEYLNNENPYSYCTDYHKNTINIPEKKIRLSALQRIQPTKVSFRMPLRDVENEREYIMNHAIEAEKAALIKSLYCILNIEHSDDPEGLMESNLDNPEVLDIAIQFKKYKLYYHQKRLRSKVAAALSEKITEDLEYSLITKKVIEIDNLKDALIYCKLKDLHENAKE